jgi:hypothetical protein
MDFIMPRVMRLLKEILIEANKSTFKFLSKRHYVFPLLFATVILNFDDPADKRFSVLSCRINPNPLRYCPLCIKPFPINEVSETR